MKLRGLSPLIATISTPVAAPVIAATRLRAGNFAYIDGHLPDGTVLPLCRLRYGGYANQWGFAIYLASKRRLPRLIPAQRRYTVGQQLAMVISTFTDLDQTSTDATASHNFDLNWRPIRGFPR